MTIPTITDDLLREIEAVYMAGWNESGEGYNSEHSGFEHETESFQHKMKQACDSLYLKIRQLEKDAARYHWIKNCEPEDIDVVIENPGDHLDAIIDSYMQAKP